MGVGLKLFVATAKDKKMKEYFGHDYHARTDEKIIRMMKDMRAEGYGLYWMLV